MVASFLAGRVDHSVHGDRCRRDRNGPGQKAGDCLNKRRNRQTADGRPELRRQSSILFLVSSSTTDSSAGCQRPRRCRPLVERVPFRWIFTKSGGGMQPVGALDEERQRGRRGAGGGGVQWWRPQNRRQLSRRLLESDYFYPYERSSI